MNQCAMCGGRCFVDGRLCRTCYKIKGAIRVLRRKYGEHWWNKEEARTHYLLRVSRQERWYIGTTVKELRKLTTILNKTIEETYGN